MAKKVNEKDNKEIKEESVQLLVFGLADEEYGVAIGDVKEIIRTGDITRVPDSPGFIAGVINVRGSIIPVLDLADMFILDEKGDSKHIIVTEQGENTFGLMVNEVTEVLRVNEREIKQAPQVIRSKLHGNYLKGVVPVKDRLVSLLDFGKMLSDEEFVRLDELLGEHRRKTKPKKNMKESSVEPEIIEEKPYEAKVETQLEQENELVPLEVEKKKAEKLSEEKTEKVGIRKTKQLVKVVE
jgi:purine-binding chemotaxis protein CheW